MKKIIKSILNLPLTFFVWFSVKVFGAEVLFKTPTQDHFMIVVKDGKKLESIYREEFDEYEIYETINDRRYCGRYSRQEMSQMMAMYIVLGKVL
jgi:hypothetical protein